MGAKPRSNREFEPNRNKQEQRRNFDDRGRNNGNKVVDLGRSRRERGIDWQEEFMKSLAVDMRELRTAMSSFATKDDLKDIKKDLKTEVAADIKSWQDDFQSKLAAEKLSWQSAAPIPTDEPDDMDIIDVETEEDTADEEMEIIAAEPEEMNIVETSAEDSEVFDEPTEENAEEEIEATTENENIELEPDPAMMLTDETDELPTESETVGKIDDAPTMGVSVTESELADLRETLAELKTGMANLATKAETAAITENLGEKITVWQNAWQENNQGQQNIVTREDIDAVNRDVQHLQNMLESLRVLLNDLSTKTDVTAVRDALDEVKSKVDSSAGEPSLDELKSSLDEVRETMQNNVAENTLTKKNVEAIKENFKFLHDAIKERDKRNEHLVSENTERLSGMVRRAQMWSAATILAVAVMTAIILLLGKH